jgi:hypothetical protein
LQNVFASKGHTFLCCSFLKVDSYNPYNPENSLAVIDSEGNLLIFDPISGSLRAQASVLRGTRKLLVSSQQGRSALIFTWSTSQILQVWELQLDYRTDNLSRVSTYKLSLVKQFEFPSGIAELCALNVDDPRVLVVAFGDNSLALFDTESEKFVMNFKSPGSSINSLCRRASRGASFFCSDTSGIWHYRLPDTSPIKLLEFDEGDRFDKLMSINFPVPIGDPSTANPDCEYLACLGENKVGLFRVFD